MSEEKKPEGIPVEVLRRAWAKAYHPDNFTEPHVKKEAEELMKDLNAFCDQHKGQELVKRK